MFVRQATKSIGLFSAVGQFEKRERPKVIADGHRDAIIDCLYKNTNTGDVISIDMHIELINTS
jgi:hypothetical protein